MSSPWILEETFIELYGELVPGLEYKNIGNTCYIRRPIKQIYLNGLKPCCECGKITNKRYPQGYGAAYCSDTCWSK